MSNCKRDGSDRLLKELVGKGINVILPPRAGIKPGDLVVADKTGGARLGDWTIVLGLDPSPNGQSEPSFKSVSFTASDALKVGAGGSIAGRALAAFGLGSGSFEGALNKTGASELKIALTAPAVSSLSNLDNVLQALRDGRAAPQPGYEDRRFLVITRVWRGRGLSLELLSKTGDNIKASAKVTEELQAQTKLQIADRHDGRITFIAEKALVFGVTLNEIEFDSEGVRDLAAQQHFTLRGENDEEPYTTISEELFVDLPDLEDARG